MPDDWLYDRYLKKIEIIPNYAAHNAYNAKPQHDMSPEWFVIWRVVIYGYA